MIDPYFYWPLRIFNNRYDHIIRIGRGFECMWSLFLANDPYFWESSEGHKNGLPGPQMILFTKIIFFSRVHTLDSCFLQKNALILVKYSLQSPV